MGKSVKSPKKKQQRKKKSSKKAFNITEDARDIAIGVVAAAGLLGLGYAKVIAPILKEKKLRTAEAKETEELKNTVEKRMVQRRESAKVKALKAYEDIKRKLAETVLTREPRVSIPSTSPMSPGFPKFPGFYSPTATAKGSPVKPPASLILDSIPKNSQKLPAPEFTDKGAQKVSTGLKAPFFSILDDIDVIPQDPRPIPRTPIPPDVITNKAPVFPVSITRPYPRYVPPKAVPKQRYKGKGVFTNEQNQILRNILTRGGDPTEFIESITGTPYIPSGIKLTSKDSLTGRLHVIQGTVLNLEESAILKGLESVREKQRLDKEKKIPQRLDDLAPTSYKKLQEEQKKN